MTRAKDDLHLVVPQCFFAHGQHAQGDRHVYASRTRFIPDRLLGLFRQLGELRDVQILAEWVQQLSGAEDPVGQKLQAEFSDAEKNLREAASKRTSPVRCLRRWRARSSRCWSMKVAMRITS